MLTESSPRPRGFPHRAAEVEAKDVTSRYPTAASSATEPGLAGADYFQKGSMIAAEQTVLGDTPESSSAADKENARPQQAPRAPLPLLQRSATSALSRPPRPRCPSSANCLSASASLKLSSAKQAPQIPTDLRSWAELTPLCTQKTSSFARALKSEPPSSSGEGGCVCRRMYRIVIQKISSCVSVPLSEQVPLSTSANARSEATSPPGRAPSWRTGEDWETDVNILSSLQSVARFHPSWLFQPRRSPQATESTAEGHQSGASLCAAFIADRAQSLRSSVARHALRTAAALFRAWSGKQRDPLPAESEEKKPFACRCECPCCGDREGGACPCCTKQTGEGRGDAATTRGAEGSEDEVLAVSSRLLPVLLNKAGAAEKRFLVMEAEDALTILAACLASSRSSTLLASTLDGLEGCVRNLRTSAPAGRFLQTLTANLLDEAAEASLSAGVQARHATGQATHVLESPRKRAIDEGGAAPRINFEPLALPGQALPLLLAFGRAQHAGARKAARAAVENCARVAFSVSFPNRGSAGVSGPDAAWRVRHLFACLRRFVEAAEEEEDRNKRARFDPAQAGEVPATPELPAPVQDSENLCLLRECIAAAVAADRGSERERRPAVEGPRVVPLHKRLELIKRQKTSAEAPNDVSVSRKSPLIEEGTPESLRDGRSPDASAVAPSEASAAKELPREAEAAGAASAASEKKGSERRANNWRS
ncbi:hypothetical protein BESB_013320 [Besnoitia besnoiti]|uniref:Uncharacterized protein n=1 Tax=Besnoitia besnoiti TaxID=94643 RepID=A0A2A9MBF1_BESBE|nr:hypothetical protein BESB_013320 [Besnoitia besnoiti]PFH32720.1 hypothetical protein BESB_013320 [Besnoitia besnoiti]